MKGHEPLVLVGRQEAYSLAGKIGPIEKRNFTVSMLYSLWPDGLQVSFQKVFHRGSGRWDGSRCTFCARFSSAPFW
ncbi:hypothetical protein MTBLM1_80149 [Rhodospirillaceae bacterium LM-1]|nr:hypothetical protein MTBLM1_80149 [Rhodospirillaceae bacterium LM-1]